ncbi:hypothetical protein [Catenovulum adriaticum]|uniref:Uncharacterized protein n=1 Tax=Catenovulum adriaticum TaxID=2984846 RepID=A0ABY7AKQ2_9ALTE|nr:hypothetical protein [Catenovulum sp. TS8]WAJ69857.1 hypothetical protein OLW01_11960 [Catenovulum sp. TS8]
MDINWSRCIKVACLVMLLVLAFQLIFIRASRVDWLAVPFSGVLYVAIVVAIHHIKKSWSNASSSNLE